LKGCRGIRQSQLFRRGFVLRHSDGLGAQRHVDCGVVREPLVSNDALVFERPFLVRAPEADGGYFRLEQVGELHGRVGRRALTATGFIVYR
jgi:hypothetical protein